MLKRLLKCHLHICRMHVLLNRKREFLLYLSFPNTISQLTMMKHRRKNNSHCRASYADGSLQGLPYRIPHWFGKDTWRSSSPTSLQEQVQVAQDLVRLSFYSLQEIPEPLLAPVQVLGHPYSEKKFLHI